VPPSRTAGRQAARPRLAAPSARSRLPLLVGNGRPIEKVPGRHMPRLAAPGSDRLPAIRASVRFCAADIPFRDRAHMDVDSSAVSYQLSAFSNPLRWRG
jgi:hypothetical protein